MDFRSQFIKHADNGLLALFEQVIKRVKNPMTRLASDPIDIKTVGIGLREPANVPKSQQPAVFFDYGDSRRLEGERYAGYEGETFTVDILAVIDARPNAMPPQDLIDRTGAMRLLIDDIRQQVRALPVTDEVNVRDVVISYATKDRRELSEYASVLYGLTYIYEYQ